MKTGDAHFAIFVNVGVNDLLCMGHPGGGRRNKEQRQGENMGHPEGGGEGGEGGTKNKKQRTTIG